MLDSQLLQFVPCPLNLILHKGVGFERFLANLYMFMKLRFKSADAIVELGNISVQRAKSKCILGMLNVLEAKPLS
jgi:hypothetical protein